jgi:UDP-N-acetylmuramyl pentapeptide phosphotransferase/UDP-N-acetylglucosamine-1-phosphate transferase
VSARPLGAAASGAATAPTSAATTAPTSASTTGLRSAFTSAVTTALTSSLATVALRRWPPGGAALWGRTNHRGEPVTLLEGPALVLGATAGLLAAPGVPSRARAGALAALVGAGVLGGYDDLAGDGRRKGLAGHLGALARGEVTTGAVKLLGLAGTGVMAAAAVPAGGGLAPTAIRRLADVAVGGAVVAGSANLLNLLDLRPGRALKAALLGAAAVLTRACPAPDAADPAPPTAAALAAGALVLLPADLAERTMLGDCGANAAGALLGVAALGRLGPRGRAAALLALVTLTAASERISFTRVIESTPGLRELDRLGRRPAGTVDGG